MSIIRIEKPLLRRGAARIYVEYIAGDVGRVPGTVRASPFIYIYTPVERRISSSLPALRQKVQAARPLYLS